MKNIILLFLTLLFIGPLNAQVNAKFRKVTATRKVVTPLIKGMSDTIIGDQYMNCEISGEAVKIVGQEVQGQVWNKSFMIKDALCNHIVYKVVLANEIMGSTYVDFEPIPPLDLLAGFTIAELIYTPELKLKNVKHLKADTNTIRSKIYINSGQITPQIESFSNGVISGWILYNDRGDKCYIYPNSAGDGMAVSATKP